MKMAVIGCRHSQAYSLVKSVLNNLDPAPTMIISGGATGIDECAWKYAKEVGIVFLGYPPSKEDKAQYGYVRACKRRNLRIVLGAELVVAFPSSRSKGTWHGVNLAKKFHIPVKIIKLP